MANDIDLTVPNLTTPGPAYASQISDDLTKIATHNHDGVNKGTTIDIAAQACNEDLSLQAHNLSNARSVELNNQPAKLTGSQDVNCLYVNQNNLGFNTSDGTFVPITQGDTLAPSALSTFLNWIMRSGSASPVTANASILAADTYNFVSLNSVGGSFTVTLPIAATIVPVALGRLYVFRDVNNACGEHPVTIQVAPGSGNTFADDGAVSFVLNTNGAYVAIYTDGISKWFTWSQNTYQGEHVSLNGSTLEVKNESFINVDGSTGSGISCTGIFLQSGGLFGLIGSANRIAGGTVSLDTAVAATWSGGSTETFATGTSETFQSGANLTLSAGSTTSSAGTLNVSGTTSVTGTTSITGPTSVSVANLSVNGTGSSTITLSKASTFSDVGTAIIGGMVETTVFPAPNVTFNCDASGQLDNFIGLSIGNGTNFAINLPNPGGGPPVGRVIWVVVISNTASYPTVTYSVNVSGNGQSMLGGLTPFTFPNFGPGTFAGSGTGSIGNVAGVAFIFVGGAIGWAIQNQFGFLPVGATQP